MINSIKIIGIILSSLIGMAILYIFLFQFSYEFHENDQYTFGNALRILFVSATYYGIKFLNKKINGLSIKDYGFDCSDLIKNIFIGIILAIIIMIIILSLSHLFFGVQIKFGGLKTNFINAVLSTFSYYLIVGIWEEFYFRGFLFITFLKNNLGFNQSALISSVIFSLIHVKSFNLSETSWLWFVGIIFIGYIIVYIYTYTNSIWSVVFFHAVWDILCNFMDDMTNKIGLFEISNYTVYEQQIDNLAVGILGSLLVIIYFTSKKKNMSNKINRLLIQVTTTKNNTNFSKESA